MLTRLALAGALVAAVATSPGLSAQTPATPGIDDYFRTFTVEWVGSDPNLARSTRYFTGVEQDRLDRQLTPATNAYRRSRIELSRRGLQGLRAFDRATMSDSRRLFADVMEWQLQSVVDEEPSSTTASRSSR